MIRQRDVEGLRYQVIVYTGRDGRTGKDRYIRRTVRRSSRASALSAAKALERRLRVQVADGEYKGTGATFGELLDAWLEATRQRLSPTTLHGYESKIKHHIRPALGALEVGKVTTARLDRLYVELAKKPKPGLAPATIRQVHAIISKALNEAVRWGWIASNPAMVRGTAPSVPKRRAKLPTIYEARSLVYEAMRVDDDFGLLVALAAATGARRGELCGLRRNRVDLKAGVVEFVETAVEMDRRVEIKSTKTDEPRRVAIDDATVKLLRSHYRKVTERALAVGVRLVDNPYVAVGSLDGSTPVRPNSVSERFRHVNRRLGLSVRFHDLRHWHASHLLDAGVPLATVSERLGHRDQSTTSNIYSHPVSESDRRAASTIGRALRGQAHSE